MASLERLIDFRPIEITLLPKGAFSNYKDQRQAEGASLVNLKPPHINPPEKVLSLLGAKVRAMTETEAEAEAVAVRSR